MNPKRAQFVAAAGAFTALGILRWPGNAAEFSNDELAQAAFQHSGEGDVEGIARPSIDEISDAIENGARTRIRDDAVQMVQNNVKVIINETSPFRSTAYYLGSQ